MKFIIFALFFSFSLLLLGSITPSSLPFSNSYLQRSSGVEAIYWNPANIGMTIAKNEILLMPFTAKADNNSISLNLYNRINGKFLDEDKKKSILSSINNNLSMGLSFNMILAGYSTQDWAISTAINMLGRGRIDKTYLEILLNGNEYNREYLFNSENNNFAILGYQDFSIAYGGIVLNDIPVLRDYDLPLINMGIGFSSLLGIYNAEMYRFNGKLSASDSGINLDQIATVRSGTLGYGYKLSWGISSSVIDFEEHIISVGLSFDNVLGKITWNSQTEETHYIAKIDSLYFNRLDDDIFKEEQITEKISSYSTDLPLNMKFGTKYSYEDLTVSFDLAKNFGSHKAYFFDPEIAFGFEYLAGQYFPLQIGYRIPYGNRPSLYSIGLGLRFKYFEWGLGYQSVGALFTEKTKGVAVSGQVKIRFK